MKTIGATQRASSSHLRTDVSSFTFSWSCAIRFSLTFLMVFHDSDNFVIFVGFTTKMEETSMLRSMHTVISLRLQSLHHPRVGVGIAWLVLLTPKLHFNILVVKPLNLHRQLVEISVFFFKQYILNKGIRLGIKNTKVLRNSNRVNKLSAPRCLTMLLNASLMLF